MRSAILCCLLSTLSVGCSPDSSSDVVLVATTTSTQDSGLLDMLVPLFKSETGLDAKIVAVGSGQALEMGRRGDVDVLLTHAPAAEIEFVGMGYGIERRAVMHNDFVIVGPPADAAHVKACESVLEALRRIASEQATFVSRADNSGTHMKEQALWAEGRIEHGSWYLESGSGMGATLRIANEKLAYTLCDRGTFLAQRAKLELVIVHEGDEPLRNDYAVTIINPARHENVNVKAARQFAAFLVSPGTQQRIADFGTDEFGQPLFFPDAADSQQ